MDVQTHDYAQPGGNTGDLDVESGGGAQNSNLGRLQTASSSSLPEASSADFVKRRLNRSNTAQSYRRDGTGQQASWQPGEEPGLDPTQPDIGASHVFGESVREKDIHQRCDITVVDFSQDNMRLYRLDNDNLGEFLSKEREPWVTCRWINVNGLGWDVVRLLASHKRLHRLALEDLMHTANRTKVDWYSDHTFIVLAMQKLIKLRSDETDGSSQSGDQSETEAHTQAKPAGHKHGRSRAASFFRHARPSKKRTKRFKVIKSALIDLLTPAHQKKRLKGTDAGAGNPEFNPGVYLGTGEPLLNAGNPRTLQRYQGGPNEERIDFMERHAVLNPVGLAVAIEQVSIFLHADNTITSFFEDSAEDIEAPIVRRLQSPGTILRQSCDASMVLEAILDAIADLSIPVTTAYQDAIGDLELEVLTDPDISQSTKLYILTSEITVLRNAVQPIIGVINSLRDHRGEPQPTVVTRAPSPSRAIIAGNDSEGVNIPSAVTISSMCHTYLGDVLDQCITTTEGYDQMRRAADNMIDLIFNTVGAHQNDSMKQLTLVTCMFLPLTFLTGYFGMNFDHLSGIAHGDSYFWMIAIPFVIVILVILLRETIQRYLVKLAQKQLIKQSRKRRNPE